MHSASSNYGLATDVDLWQSGNLITRKSLGQTEEGSKAYIYKVVDDVFVEIWGVLDESDSRVRALRWERERSEE